MELLCVEASFAESFWICEVGAFQLQRRGKIYKHHRYILTSHLPIFLSYRPLTKMLACLTVLHGNIASH
jgi:hypothetical protein